MMSSLNRDILQQDKARIFRAYMNHSLTQGVEFLHPAIYKQEGPVQSAYACCTVVSMHKVSKTNCMKHSLITVVFQPPFYQYK